MGISSEKKAREINLGSSPPNEKPDNGKEM